MSYLPKMDATPAPLDPSKVKAGDTVTVTRGKASHTGVVIGLPNWGYVLDTGAKQHEDYYSAHTDYISDDEAWTLTAHQPAPEPEPEWKPGTTGSATVRGVEGVRVLRSHRTGSVASEFWLSDREVDGYLQHQDAHVTDVRLLVVIDPAAVDVDALQAVIDSTSDADAVLAELGIETAR